VKEDGRGAGPLSAIQAVLRSQIKMAADGNVRAQCAILAMIREVEQADAVGARLGTLYGPVNNDDAAAPSGRAGRRRHGPRLRGEEK
jgi:hypothetical protein